MSIGAALILPGCDSISNSNSVPSSPSVSAPAENPEAGTSDQAIPPVAEIPQDDFTAEEGFTALAFSDFTPVFANEETWKEHGTSIVTTGEPKGYLQTSQTFSNFTLKLEYRFLPKPKLAEEKRPLSNTGVLLYIDEEQAIWPKSVEVQGKHVEMASIKSNGGIPDVVITDDQAAREAARKPVGEWNELTIISADGALTSFLNGTQICQSEPAERQSGHLGFQAEGFPVEFRRIRIQTR